MGYAIWSEQLTYLTVTYAKTVIMRLRTRGVPDASATSSVEAFGLSKSTVAYATPAAAYGRTPSNCTNNGILHLG